MTFRESLEVKNVSVQLGVNTSQSDAELVLFDGDSVIANFEWQKAKSHSEVITHALSKIIKTTSHELSDIDKVYCVVGPGSFTGIRVGANFAKTIAYSLKVPIVPINQLDLQAASFKGKKGVVLSVLDAQKNSVFCSLFNCDNGHFIPIFANQVISIDHLQKYINDKVTVVGRGLDLYEKFLAPQLLNQLEFYREQKASLINVFKSPVQANKIETLSWQELSPLYIKASAPEEKLNPTKTGIF